MPGLTILGAAGIPKVESSHGLKIDLETNDVIAEHVGFLIDPGQGSTAGSRSPWDWAKSYAPRCPKSDVVTKDFATRVLRPRRGD